jgi:hydrogenase maturation factor
VLAITTDPCPWSRRRPRAPRAAVHLVASDLWTSGIPPAWASVALNLPPSLEGTTLDRYAQALHEEWAQPSQWSPDTPDATRA